uniref:DUF1127 domain-containing protein n=1 Tax=Yoonia sp. TaxID=2212373 RepID=UPI004048D7A7
MAVLTHTGIAPANSSFFAKFKQALRRYVEAVIAARGRSEEIARLQNMSDSQLADIGIERQDIVKIVFRDKLHR